MEKGGVEEVRESLLTEHLDESLCGFEEGEGVYTGRGGHVDVGLQGA